MKRFATLVVLLLTSSLLTACGSSDPHDAAMDDLIEISDEMLTVLQGIEDVESAKAAEEDFKAIGEKMKAFATSASELEPPSDEKEQELKEKYEQRVEAIQEKFEAEMQRIGELGPLVMLAVGQSMSEMDPGNAPDWIENID